MSDSLKAYLNRTKYTPPNWMRHFFSYRMLGFIDERTNTCWAGMVMWKQGYGWDWWPTSTCFQEDCTPKDYCGKFEAKP